MKKETVICHICVHFPVLGKFLLKWSTTVQSQM